jgi:UDP-glucose 4-epimerase
MAERTALVTGAAGFIGSHLCERLVAEGWRVRGVDCFTSYYDPALKERNLGALARDPRFVLERADLRTADPAPLLEDVEIVWHLAAQAGVRASWGHAFEDYTTINVNATQRLLEAMRSRPIRRAVIASSSSVYGDAPQFPMPEDGALRPISPYGVTKVATEMLARIYASLRGVPAVALRYFTVYGPRQRPDMSFHKFLRAILSGQPLPIYGDGRQTRDFTFVEDVTEANLLAAEHGEPGGVYNISGGSRVSMLEVIRRMEAVTGRTAKLEFQERQTGDALHTGGDGTRARTVLGFAPKVDLDAGLAAEAEWMRRYLEGAAE